MTISLREIAVRDLADDYEDRGDEGVVGYGGCLDIRSRLVPRPISATWFRVFGVSGCRENPTPRNSENSIRRRCQ